MSTEDSPGNALPLAEAVPILPDSQTAKTPLAVRDEQGHFVKGNPGGPGRPAGRRDRINAALEALREHYGTATQAEAIQAFVLEIVKGVTGNTERLDLLRLLLPKETSAEIAADVRMETQRENLSDEERVREEDACIAVAKMIQEQRAGLLDAGAAG